MNIYYPPTFARKTPRTREVKKSVLTSVLFCIAMLAFCRPARAYISLTGGASYVLAKQCQVSEDSAIVRLLYMPTDGLISIYCWEGCEVSLDKVSWSAVKTFYLPAGVDTQKLYYRLTFPSAVTSAAYYTGFDLYASGESQSLIIGAMSGIGPASITSDGPVCIGATAHLSADIYDGMSYSWAGPGGFTSTVSAPSFVVGSVAAGGVYSLTMTMTGSWGCTTTVTTNVMAVSTPGPITGNIPVCTGLTNTLHIGVHGGTWSSSNTTVASVGSTSGIATGVTAGTSVISYINGVCSASAVMTVNNTYPAAIAGTAAVCSGSTTTLSNTVAGGIWSCVSTGVATVGSSTGVVSGRSIGTAVVTYDLGGCRATKTVTVDPVSTIEGWAVKAPMPQALSHFGAAAIDSIIYVVGGSNGSVAVNTLYAYNINSNTWSVKASMSVPRVELAAVAVNGKLYAMGGYDGSWSVSTVEEYDPVTNTWTTKAPMPRQRAQLSAAVIGNKIYVEAGWIETFRELDVYDVTTDTWETKAPMEVGRLGINAAVGLDNKFYYLGGKDYFNTSFYNSTAVYDVASDAWSAGPDMPYHRFGGQAVVLYNRVYYMGGASGGYYLPNYTTNNYLNPVTGVWYTALDLINKRSAGCAVMANDKIYLIGGIDSVGSTVAWNHQYTPAAITVTGASVICAGSTSAFASEGTGGTWSSSNTSVATVGAGGVVTGVSGGTAVISYIKTGACGTIFGTKTITVNTVPAVASITGGNNVCAGITIALSNATGGGVWSSGSTSVAVIGAATGIVTGVAAGTAIISYAVTNSCGTGYATKIITVNASTGVDAIAGPASVCVGITTTLTNTTGGGVWSSTNTSVASIGSSSGIVTGIMAGTTTISYVIPGGCGVTKIVTVNPAYTIESWTVKASMPEPRSHFGAAAIDSIIYVVGGSNGSVAVNTLFAYNINSNTWSVKAPMSVQRVELAAVAVNGKLYALGGYDGSWSVSTVEEYDPATNTWTTKTPMPRQRAQLSAAVIGNKIYVEAGWIETFKELDVYDVTTNTWETKAPMALGRLGINAAVGLDNKFYYLGGKNYANTAFYDSTAVYNVATDSWSAGPNMPYQRFGGQAAVLNDRIYYMGGASGGYYLPNYTTNNYLDPATGVWYTALDLINKRSAGCAVPANNKIYLIGGIDSLGSIVTWNHQYSPGSITITGASDVCAGGTTSFGSDIAGGTWSSSNASVATVGTGGVVTGVSGGTAVITYTKTGACGSVYGTRTITVNPLPSVSSITGTTGVCAGATATLGNATTGGVWTSSNTSVATVGSSTGVVNGIAAGTALISYAVTNGCGTTVASTTVTVNIVPSAGVITGASSVTVGASTLLTASVSGGAWSGSNANASVSGTGNVTGITAGSIVISYTVTNSCGSAVATKAVTVNAAALGAITGTLTVCQGMTTTLSNATGGGSWNSSNFAVATVGAATGIVTGVAAGTARITYYYAGYSVSAVVTVNPLPASITGASSVCMNASITLTDATAGGTWSSSNPALGTVSAAGVVTGIAVGTPVISYILGTGCYRIVSVPVKGLPGGITGNTGLCVGGSSTLTAGTGTSWSSSNPSVATIGAASGVLSGVSPGTSVITFNATTGCIATKIATVNTAPSVTAITGPSGVLIGHTITLSNATPGGVWSSNSTARATVSAGGVVTGISAPAATISYTVANGVCSLSVSKLITVTSNRPGIAEDAGSIMNIKVYPNPTTGILTVESMVNGAFTVYTLEGKQLQSMNVSAGVNTFNLPNGLAAGVYMCRFNGEDGSSAIVRLVYQ